VIFSTGILTISGWFSGAFFDRFPTRHSLTFLAPIGAGYLVARKAGTGLANTHLTFASTTAKSEIYL